MGFIEDLATWLDTNSTALTVGVNLFCYGAPDVDRAVVFLTDESGVEPIRSYGNDFPKAERPQVWVTSRSTQAAQGSFPSPLNARKLSQRVWAALESITDVNMPSTGQRVWSAMANGSPGWAGRDDKGRAHFLQTFDVFRTPSTGDYG